MLPGDNQNIAMQIRENHSKNIRLAFINANMNLSLMLVLSSKEIAVVFAEK